jgi:CrcB protein
MSSVPAWVGVGACGALGAYGRFFLSAVIDSRHPGAFPLGTFTVNLTGGFLLGLMTGLAVAGEALLVLGTGLLGAFTTFSTWMVEAQRLGEAGRWATMWLHLGGSMVAGLASTGLGWLLGEAIR